MGAQGLNPEPKLVISGPCPITGSFENQAIRIFRYVRHEDRDAYERDGWIFAADLGPTHGHYAVLMEKIDRKS